MAAYIERGAERAADLTRSLLAFARRAHSNPRSLDLGESVREAERLLRGSLDARYRLECRVAPGLWTVRADAVQIQQVLMNLAINARDAMPEGGLVTIEVYNLPAEPGGEPAVGLAVTDGGAGMDVQVRARIFEPFFTTKGPGQGTGLSVVYGIVSLHGGTISVDSEPGRGTRFEVRLPVGGGSPEPIRAAASAALPPGSERILVAEDEPAIRALVEQVLGGLGYRVETVSDGAEVLERFRRDPDCADLVLLDVTMAGLGGHETLAALRERGVRAPVLLASGYNPGHGGQAADAFLPKPFRMGDLARAVRGVLDRAGRDRS